MRALERARERGRPKEKRKRNSNVDAMRERGRNRQKWNWANKADKANDRIHCTERCALKKKVSALVSVASKASKQNIKQ